jgi:hypothetical protein
MAIGVTPNTNYFYEGTVGKINGYDSTAAAGVQANIGQSIQTFLITAKDTGASAVDLRTLTGAGKAIDAIFRVLPQGILAYFITNSGAGTISLIVDGVNAPTAAGLQATSRALGTVGTADLTGTTVVAGTSFAVA